MTNSLFIGVDVSLQSNQICVLNFDQHKFFNLKFPNTPDGCEESINKIKNIYDKFYFDIGFDDKFFTRATGLQYDRIPDTNVDLYQVTKYINENIATVYIEADINVVLEETADFEGKQEDTAATVQSDYVIISLDELLNK